MGKIKAFFRNKWVGFTLASILYILWFVLWTGNWWLLLGEIVIFDNLVRGSMRNVEQVLKDPRVRLVKGDIRDRAAIEAVTEGMDAVIHMAAIRITACAADPREAMEVMNDGTYNVIEAAHKAKVQRVLAGADVPGAAGNEYCLFRHTDSVSKCNLSEKM